MRIGRCMFCVSASRSGSVAARVHLCAFVFSANSSLERRPKRRSSKAPRHVSSLPPVIRNVLGIGGITTVSSIVPCRWHFVWGFCCSRSWYQVKVFVMRTCLFRCLVGEFPVLLTGWVRLNVSRVPCGRCVGVLPSLLRSMCRLMSWLIGWLRQCR